MNIQHVMSEQNAINQSVFTQVKNIFEDYFEQLVGDFCYRLDVEVSAQLNKANRSDFAQVSSYLRNLRTDLKNNYIEQVFSLFNQGDWLQTKNIAKLQDAALVEAKSVEEGYVINQIVRDCNKQYFDEAAKVNHLLAKMYGVQAIKTEENPIGIQQLLSVFEAVIKNYQIKPDYRIALYKAFAVNVAQQMGIIYQELIDKVELLPASKSTSNKIVNNSQNGMELSADLMRLQKELSQWREAQSPSTYDSIPSLSDEFYQLTELKTALRQLRLKSTQLNVAENKKPLKWQLVELIADANDDHIYKGLTSNYEDILDFISIVFNEIKQDEKISTEVKRIILALESQLAGLLLIEPGAFTLSHPVLELINGLYEAAIFLNQADQHDKVIIKKIEKTAVAIRNQEHLEICQQLALDMLALVEKIKQRSALVEQRTISLMQNKEHLALARQYVAQAIDNSIADYEVPVLITDFLYNAWYNVLLLAHVKKNNIPGLWDKAIKTMNLLVASSLSPMTDEKKKQLKQYLPMMIKNIQGGLGIISYGNDESAKLFKELADFHLALMNNPEFKPVISEKKVVKRPLESFNMIPTQNKELPVGLVLNDWLAFKSDSAIRWGKLSWKGSRSDVLVFVAKSGAKLLDIKQDELLKRLDSGAVSILPMDTRPFIEQVFAKVISHDGALER